MGVYSGGLIMGSKKQLRKADCTAENNRYIFQFHRIRHLRIVRWPLQKNIYPVWEEFWRLRFEGGGGGLIFGRAFILFCYIILLLPKKKTDVGAESTKMLSVNSSSILVALLLNGNNTSLEKEADIQLINTA